MRRRTSLLRFLILASVFSLVGCCAVWIAGMTIFGIPQAITHLGPPSSNLNPLERTALSLYLLINEGRLDSPAGNHLVSYELEVIPGEPASAAVDRLQTAGVVSDGALLRNYLRYRGLDVRVAAGLYRLHGGMTVREIAESLQIADLSRNYLTVLEGWRVEEIARALPEIYLSFQYNEFLVTLHSRIPDYAFTADLPDPPSLEGYLFPDTYHLSEDMTAIDLVKAMLDNFEDQVDAELRAQFSQNGLSLHQAVTLASIIEREAVIAEEGSVIASVFLNRLALGMKLDADPTVQYAIGSEEDGWWKTSLTLDDLIIQSPYNTYIHDGLPPGPIANPGLSALRAVAFPAETTYLYFRAMCDGSGRHAFAVTYEEHIKNACE
jgi:UPF0755 protein